VFCFKIASYSEHVKSTGIATLKICYIEVLHFKMSEKRMRIRSYSDGKLNICLTMTANVFAVYITQEIKGT